MRSSHERSLFNKLAMILLLFTGFYSNIKSQNIQIISTGSSMPVLDSRRFSNANNFMLQIVNPDVLQTKFFRINMEIEGNGIKIISDPDFISNPIKLENTPVRILSSTEIAEYFDLENLVFSGYSKEEYVSNDGLPDGVYSICFKLYDATGDAHFLIGAKSCITVWMKREDPPKITYPVNQPEILAENPNFITWIPRHLARSATEYNLEIFENDPDMSYLDIIQYHSPVISSRQSIQSYLLLAQNAILKPGREYFVVVKALSDNIVFKNGGYSNPEYFTYGKNELRTEASACPLPSGKIFINEISQGCFGTGNGSREYVELVVVGEGNSSVVNLENFIIDDNNYPIAEVGNEPGHIRFGSCFNNVPVGTIIILYNNDDVNPLINPANDGMPGSGGFWQIPFNSSCLKRYSLCPDHAGDGYNCNQDEIEVTWNNYIPMRNTNDVMQVREPDGKLQHALIWITDLFEYYNSNKTVKITNLTTADSKTFAFTTGTNWFEAANWEIHSCSGGNQSTPGIANSKENQTLIDNIKNGSVNDFYISCSVVQTPTLHVNVDVHLSSPGNQYAVYIDGVFIENSNGATYNAGNPGQGIHEIKLVEIETNCVADCVFEINCSVGTPCNDYNLCTINDVINQNCICQGEDLFTVTFDTIGTDTLCDYCVYYLYTCDQNSLEKTLVHSITFMNELGDTIVLDSSTSGMHFPYCYVGPSGPPPGQSDCQGYSSMIIDFVQDLNAWISSHNYQGFATLGDDPDCYPVRAVTVDTCFSELILQFTDLTFISYYTEYWYNNWHDSYENEFWGPHDCAPGNDSIVASVECDGPYTYQWSTGANTPGINIEGSGPGACYSVTVTCGNGCSYVGTFGDGCNCIVGTPCPGEDPCYYYGYYDNQCHCNDPIPLPDSDGDGVCDELDQCPGEPDVDFDGDGIIDCEDEEVSCQNLTANISITENQPGDCYFSINLDSILGDQNTVLIEKIILSNNNDNFEITGNGFPICYGNLPETNFQVSFDDFEQGWGFWSGLPNDAKRVKENSSGGGEYSIRLRGHDEFAHMTSQSFSVDGMNKAKIAFDFITDGYQDNAEKFLLEVSYDNGQSYEIIKEGVFGSDFNNNTIYSILVEENITNQSFMKCRIRSLANDDDSKVFIDRVQIHKIQSACTKSSAIAILKNRIENWLQTNGYSGQVLTTAPNLSDTCTTSGTNLYIHNTNILFSQIEYNGLDESGVESFCTIQCSGIFGQFSTYTIKVTDINCENPTFLWSNGSTIDSIVINSINAYQFVTVTCENGCDTILQFGLGNCVYGNPCIPTDPCFTAGVYDEFCQCIGTEPAGDIDEDGICDAIDPCPYDADHTDYDGDGVPDCAFGCYYKVVQFSYQPITADVCDLCIDIDNISDKFLLNVIVIDANNNQINLNTIQGFNFPYCDEILVSTCEYNDPFEHNYEVRPSIKRFMSHFYQWAVQNNPEIVSSIENTNTCSGTEVSVLIKNHVFSDIRFVFTGNDVRNSTQLNCRVDTVKYKLCASLNPPAPICGSPQYLWSNGAQGNCIEVLSQNIGAAVTITCGNNCIYTNETPGTDCLLGTPCSYPDTCVTYAVYNEYCVCTPVYQPQYDADGDKVTDKCDKCPGHNDNVDIDGDGIPDGCDICPMDSIRTCRYCVDLMPNPNIGCYTVHGYSIQNAAGQLQIINIPNIPVCPQFGQGIQALVNALNQSFQLNGIPAQASYTGNNCSPLGHSITIQITNSNIRFLNLLIKGLLITLPFNEHCEFITIPKPCDDGNPCTINDRYDENCNCVGDCPDIDQDGVCDGIGDGRPPCDICLQGPDYLDLNNNGRPDACEDNIFDCNGQNRSYCEHLDIMKNCSSNPDKMHEFDMRFVSTELRDFFAEVNFAPTHFNIPQLMTDLQNQNDQDHDGIYDYLDPCPNYTNQFDSDGRIIDLGDCCGNVTYDALRMSLMLNWMFQPVNWMNENTGAMPHCAIDLGITVMADEDGFLITQDSCQIEFSIDCNCNCTSRLLNDIQGDGICGVQDSFIIIDPPCDGKVCPEPGTNADPCSYYMLEECVCVEYFYPDSDGDGFCDLIDQCPDENDGDDADSDGIPDCIDACPGGPITNHHPNPELPDPTGPGDPCDDGNACTYADAVDASCNCIGQVVDIDDDGFTDCGECKIFFIDPDVSGAPPIEVTDRGPFLNCNECYFIANNENGQGDPCDICPDLDDAEDYNNNGVPDCLDPPYREIGCPSGFSVVDGVGIVLTFDGDNISEDDLPEPIAVVLTTTLGSASILQSNDYLTIGNTRVVGNTFEVIYPFDVDLYDNYSFVGISYADHQGCVFSSDTTSTDDLADIICPTEISVYNGLLIASFNYGSNTPDLTAFTGNLEINLTSTNPDNDPITSSFGMSFEDLESVGTNSYNLILGDTNGSDYEPFSEYSGSITLPNGIVCTYEEGSGLVLPCNGEAPGSPCTPDPEEPCKYLFRLDNNCNCIGDDKPDSDDDGMCDEIDPCPDFANSNPDGSDCECDELELMSGEDPQIVNGNDLSIPFNTANASSYNNVNISISGGPNGTMSLDTVLSNPLIVGNLPKGYSYVITITATCANGGTSSMEIPIPDIPFDNDPGLCGIKFELENLSTFTLLPELNNGDIIKASDFDVTIREAKGGYGKFTGKGYIKIPYFEFVRINVNFKDIIISVDKQLIQGYINVNGFGIAVLGDPISDIINDGINDIINVLEDLSDILDILGDILEASEELLATTENLVSENAKNCVKDATEDLNALKIIAEGPNPPADIDEQIKTASQILKDCLDAYNDELEAIMTDLLEVIELTLPKLYTPYCTSPQYDDDTNPSSFASLYNTKKIEITNFVNAQNDDALIMLPNPISDIENQGIMISEISVINGDNENYILDPNVQTLADDFYEIENNWHYCYNLDLMVNSPEKIQTPGAVTQLLQMFLQVGDAIGPTVLDLLEQGQTPEQISNDLSIHVLFEEYLRKATQNKDYGNIKD